MKTSSLSILFLIALLTVPAFASDYSPKFEDYRQQRDAVVAQSMDEWEKAIAEHKKMAESKSWTETERAHQTFEVKEKVEEPVNSDAWSPLDLIHNISVEGRVWFADFDSQVKIVDSGVGTSVDGKSDLGFDNKNLSEVRVNWQKSPQSNLRYAFTHMAYRGDKTLDSTVEFNGKTYSMGTEVQSEMDLKYHRISWLRKLMSLSADNYHAGWLAELKILSMDVSLETPNLSPRVSESESLTVPLPSLGAFGDFSFTKENDLNAFVEFSGMTLGSLGHFYDTEFGLKYNPIKEVSLLGGYRIINMKAEYHDNALDLELKGPFIGGAINF